MRLQLGLAVVAGLWLASQPVKSAVREAREAWPDEEEYVVLPPPSVAPILAMGHGELAADIAWVRMLGYYADEVGKTDAAYLERFIDNIIALDPYFERIYLWAGNATVFKGQFATQKEFHNSIKYLEMGVELFPKDWETHWLLGLRYWQDLRSDDPAERRRFRETGADHFEAAMRLPGAPANLPTTLANLRTQLGQKNRAIRDLREMILTTSDKRARERMLAHYGYLLDSFDATEELRRAAESFREEWLDAMPYADPTMYILLGPPPSDVIDFGSLATERDLFGSQEGDLAFLEEEMPPAAIRDDADTGLGVGPLDDDDAPDGSP